MEVFFPDFADTPKEIFAAPIFSRALELLVVTTNGSGMSITNTLIVSRSKLYLSSTLSSNESVSTNNEVVFKFMTACFLLFEVVFSPESCRHWKDFI